MSSDEDPFSTAVPWDELSYTEKRDFYHTLRNAGLDIEDTEAAEVYYGNRHRAEMDLVRQTNMPGHDPEHDDHYGKIYADPSVELYGVGEFHPDAEGAGTPVFEAKTENGSYLTFAFLPDDVDDAYMRVFHANSYEAGEFSLLMDRILSQFQGADPDPKEVVFTNVVSEWLDGADLRSRVHGFEERTVEVPDTGEELQELVGEWDPRDDRSQRRTS